MTDYLLDFEDGTDAADVVAGGDIVVVTDPAPTYSAAAAFHGVMGVLADVQSSLRVENDTDEQSGSLYITPTTLGLAQNSCRVVAITNNSNSALGYIRFHNDGHIDITDYTNTLGLGVRASTTMVEGDRFRFDWQAEIDMVAYTCTISLRIFKNANIEGVTPNETVTSPAMSFPTGRTPGRVWVGSSSDSWVVELDTFRWSDDLQWFGPYGTPTYTGSCELLWVGTPSQTSFYVSALTSAASFISVQTSTDPGFATVDETATYVPDSEGWFRLEVTGLTPGTRYYYRLLDNSVPMTGDNEGSIKTLPGGAIVPSTTIALGACTQHNQQGAGDASDALDDIVAWDPDFMVHTGDFHYRSSESLDPVVHQDWFVDQIQNFPGHADLCANVGMFYVPSDHEAGPDNGDSDEPYILAFNEAYENIVPYSGSTDHYRTWVVGRVRFIMLDVRNPDRSPGAMAQGPTKTMLGATQKTWLFDQLDQPELLKVIISDVPWPGPASLSDGIDKWWAYDDERSEIADYITDNGINVDFWNGDGHNMAVCSGASNNYGNFPMVQSAPFANIGGGRNSGEWDEKYEINQGNQYRNYCRITITDNGQTITRTVSGWDAINGVERVSSVEGWSSAAVTTNTADFKMGSSDVDKIYHGTDLVWEPGGPAVISRVGEDSYYSDSSAADFEVTVPSGTVAGDLILLYAGTSSTATVFTGPTGVTGWVPRAEVANGSARLFQWYKIADGSEADEVVTLEPSDSGKGTMAVVVYRDAAFDDYASDDSDPGGTSVSAPTATASSNDSAVIEVYVERSSSQVENMTIPAGTTEVVYVQGIGGGHSSILIVETLLEAAGTVGGDTTVFSPEATIRVVRTTTVLEPA